MGLCIHSIFSTNLNIAFDLYFFGLVCVIVLSSVSAIKNYTYQGTPGPIIALNCRVLLNNCVKK